MGWRELASRRVDGQRALRRATEAERDLALRRIDGSGLWELHASQGAIELSGYLRATTDLAGLAWTLRQALETPQGNAHRHNLALRPLSKYG